MSTWEPLSATLLLPEEEATLEQVLAAVLRDPDTNVGSAVGYSDQNRSVTTHVYSVAVLASEGLVIGSVYQHPGRTAISVRRVSGGPVPHDPDAEFLELMEAMKKAPAE